MKIDTDTDTEKTQDGHYGYTAEEEAAILAAIDLQGYLDEQKYWKSVEPC
tara:strand:+ start:9132 stop:9281 length:150 start_codon:yes stop_codon:yes gene_type:complete